jgi:hypothetical protein
VVEAAIYRWKNPKKPVGGRMGRYNGQMGEIFLFSAIFPSIGGKQ